MPGFRPGKVPLKMVAQHYGPQVRYEVLSDAVQKALQRRGAARPNLASPAIRASSRRTTRRRRDALEFTATFEVYPEVKVGDLAGADVERPQLEVDEADGRQDARDPAQAARALRAASQRAGAATATA